MTTHQEIPLQGSNAHLSPKGEYSYRYIHISDSINMLLQSVSASMIMPLGTGTTYWNFNGASHKIACERSGNICEKFISLTMVTDGTWNKADRMQGPFWKPEDYLNYP